MSRFRPDALHRLSFGRTGGRAEEAGVRARRRILGLVAIFRPGALRFTHRLFRRVKLSYEFLHGPMPVGRLLRNRLEDDARENRRYMRVGEIGWRRWSVLHEGGELLRVLRFIGQATGEQFVESDSERVDIRPVIGRGHVPHNAGLLRSKVGEGDRRGRENVHALAKATAVESGDLDGSIRRYEDPRGVQGAVEQGSPVRGHHPLRCLTGEPAGFGDLHSGMGAAIILERGPLDVFHQDGHTAVRAGFHPVNADDLRVVEFGRNLDRIGEGFHQNRAGDAV